RGRRRGVPAELAAGAAGALLAGAGTGPAAIRAAVPHRAALQGGSPRAALAANRRAVGRRTGAAAERGVGAQDGGAGAGPLRRPADRRDAAVAGAGRGGATGGGTGGVEPAEVLSGGTRSAQARLTAERQARTNRQARKSVRSTR